MLVRELFISGFSANRLFKMELPVGGFRSLFQLGDFLKGLVCAILLVMLIVAQNSLTGNLCLVGSFHTGVFLFDLMEFAVNAGGKGYRRPCGRSCLPQTAICSFPWVLSAHPQNGAVFAFAGFLVKDTLFFQHFLGGQLLTDGIQTLMRLLGFALQPLDPAGRRSLFAEVRHFCGGFSRSFQNSIAVNLPFGAGSADLAVKALSAKALP